MNKKHRFLLRDIRQVWGQVHPAIGALKTRYALDWRPEDVYAQCMSGLAFCYMCDDGFLIVKPQENQFSLEKELFVWICHSTHDNGLADYQADICALAKEIYATTIVFESPREGFRRLALKNKWPAMTSYRMPVS